MNMHPMMQDAAQQMPHMSGGMGHMMSSPVAKGAVIAGAGYAAARGLASRGLLSHPLVMLSVGLVGGYLLHKYEKEIAIALARASGMGKDFMLHQKERLEDILQEARQAEAAGAPGGEQPKA
jgi:hypothetical protein